MSELTVSQEFLRSYGQSLSDYLGRFKSFFHAEDSNALTKAVGNLPPYRKVKPKVDQLSYPNLSLVKITVPSGLQTTYLEYLAQLDKAVAVNERLMSSVLAPFSRWLAECIADPEKLAKASKPAAINNFEPNNTDAVALAIGECFIKGNSVVTVPFGKAFARNADVEPVYLQAEDITRRFVGIDRAQVTAKVEEISGFLERIMNRVEAGEEDYQLSRTTVELLSKISYTAAQEIEFYGVVAYQLTELCTSLQQTTLQIQKA